MRLQIRDGIRITEKKGAVILFLTALVFLHRPIMSAGLYSWAGITILTEGLYVLLALDLLLFCWKELCGTVRNTRPIVKICCGVILLSGLAHWALGGFYRPEYLGLALAWGILPLFGAVFRDSLKRFLPAAFFIFWVVNVFTMVRARILDIGVFGTTGNWNWSATLMMICTPFIIYSLPKGWNHRKFLAWLIGGASAFLFYLLSSRAAFVGLVFAGGLFVFLKYRKARIWISAASVLAVCAAVLLAFTVFRAKTEAFLGSEIRMELWKSAVRMIGDHPLGVGVPCYENACIPYKTKEYFLNPHCAVRTVHPHNELLYLAASLGIPAALAFLVWYVYALFAAVREYDTGKMDRDRLTFLLLSTALLINGMFDLIFHAWPVGILSLLFFGFFAFPGEEPRAEEPGRNPVRIGKWMLVLTGILALFDLAGTFCWEASSFSVGRKDSVSAKRYAQAAMLLAPEFPNLIYRSAVEMSQRDRVFSMELVDRMEKSPWKDFAHIHALKAQNFVLFRRDDLAIPEYLRDAECFPVHIVPYFGALTAYGRLGNETMVREMEKKIGELIALRKLSGRDVRIILRHPEYDTHPEKIAEDFPPVKPQVQVR